MDASGYGRVVAQIIGTILIAMMLASCISQSKKATAIAKAVLKVALAALALVGAYFAGDAAYENLAIPFAQASIITVFSGLFLAAVAWVLIATAWHTAFD